jgi:hypothetical protein
MFLIHRTVVAEEELHVEVNEVDVSPVLFVDDANHGVPVTGGILGDKGQKRYSNVISRSICLIRAHMAPPWFFNAGFKPVCK